MNRFIWLQVLRWRGEGGDFGNKVAIFGVL